MLNICRISRGFPPLVDGLSRHVYLLSKYQSGHGHAVTILQPNAVPEVDPSIDVIQLRKIPTGRFGRFLFSLTAAAALIRVHRKSHIDVVHVHGDVFEVAAIAFTARHYLKLPCVLTVHGGTSHRRAYRTVAGIVFRRLSACVAVSEEIGLELRGLGLGADRISIISSGVEWETFSPVTEGEKLELRRQLELPKAATLATFVGRLHPVKGVGVLLDAIQRLANDEKLHVAVAGDGPCMRVVSHRAAGFANVTLLGMLSHENVRALLRASDMFLLPSVDLPRQREGIPTALLEAMAAGLPVIVSDSGGAKCIVENGVNGLVVRQGRASEFAEAIWILAYDRTAREAMGERNRKLARERDWSGVVKQIDEVYERAGVCERRPESPPTSVGRRGTAVGGSR